ncbi:MAG: nucleotidyltransferase domain-containing protein [Blastocatellales bacterium]
MKSPSQEKNGKKSASALRHQRTLMPDSELPPEAQELRLKFREWHDSFQTRAKRMAFIRKLCRRIAEAYQPEKIILFGSHAYGEPTPESDVDLMIVMDYEGRPIDQILKIQRDLDLVTPVDLLIRRPKEVKERLQDGDMFITDVLQRGKVMYESEYD